MLTEIAAAWFVVAVIALANRAYRIYRFAAEDADTARVDRATAMLSVSGRAFALSAFAWLLVAVYRA